MRILLDTHIFLWIIQNNPRVNKKLRQFILASNAVYVSSASIWEAAIKIQLGKLDANINDLVSAISGSGFLELPVTSQHAAITATLPNFHRDPFDRMLIAQAISEPLRLVSADTIFKSYHSLVELV